MIDGISVPDTTEYDEDIWLIEEKELFIDENNIKYTKKNRILSCKLEDNTCVFNGIWYIWSHKKPKCNVYETKVVTGIITTIDDQRCFTTNESLIHLEIREHLKKCKNDVFWYSRLILKESTY